MNYPFSRTFRKLTDRLRYLGCWMKWLHSPRPNPAKKMIFQALEPRVLLATNLTAASPLADTLFTDQSGEQYQVKLTGPGSVTVTLADGDGDGRGDIASLVLANTTDKSSLTVLLKKTVAGQDNEVSIGAVTGTGLGSFTALKSDLVGAGINLTGAVGKLSLDDVRNGADITLGGALPKPSSLTSITIGEITADTDINVAAPIGAATVARAESGSWSAPLFGSVTSKGTFGATLNSTAGAVALGKKPAVGKLTITGGDFTGGVSAIGDIGPISVKRVNSIGGSVIGAEISGASLKSLTAGAALGVDISLVGGLGAVKAEGTASGTWNAATVGAVSIKGGDMTADISTTAPAGKKPVIGSVTVTGGNLNADISAFGVVGPISAKSDKSGAGGDAAGKWTAVSFTGISTAGGDLDAEVNAFATPTQLGKTPGIGKVSVTDGNLTGDISAAGAVGLVKLGGKTGGGMNNATLTGGSLGKFSATGAVQNSIILAGGSLGADHAPGGTGPNADVFSLGNIAGFSAGSVASSIVGAGLVSTDGILGNDDDDLLSFPGGAKTSVKSFFIKGIASTDSLFAAGEFPKTVKMDNGSTITPSIDTRFLTTGSADRRDPGLTAALANDTGSSNTDAYTKDPSVGGVATDNLAVTELSAAFDSGAFVNVTPFLGSNGAFTLSTAALETVKGGALTDRAYALTIRAKDTAGNTTLRTVNFTLDRTSPNAPTLALSTTSDTGLGGDNLTSAGVVTLQGQAEAGAKLQFGNTQSLASNLGTFIFPNVGLADGDNLFSLTATDRAGNSAQTMLVVTRNGALATNDPVLEWNAVNLEAIRLDAASPPVATRGLAMVSTAIYDVVNAFEHAPGFLVTGTAPANASVDAAIASAAHIVLEYLFPGQKAFFDSSLTTTLSRVPDGQSETDGVAFGASIGQQIIDLRINDGADQFVDYIPGGNAGDWQPTGPMYDVALLPNWPTVDPFAMTSGDQFRPDGPPSLDSQEYADAFNEVKAIGAAVGSTRTAQETQIARFWADGTGTYSPPGHWNQIAGQIAAARGNSIGANARLMAELNVALADAAILAWDAKYAFNNWRPANAIQEADTDGNDQTAEDPTWTSFLIAPPFPDYVSGHSTFSGAAATVLTETFGENVAFSTSSYGLPGVMRNFTSFQQAADEASVSRIYGGIHWRFSCEDGLTAGRELGAFVHNRFEVAGDFSAPTVLIEQPEFGYVTSGAFNIEGRALDNLSGLASLTAQLDGGATTQIVVAANGTFSIPVSLPLDGSVNGAHVLHLVAADFAGNTTTPLNFPFTLDTIAPTLVLDSPVIDEGLGTASRVFGTVNPTGSLITSLKYSLDGGTVRPITFDPATGAFDQALDLAALAAGAHTITVTSTDGAGLTTSVTRNVTLAAPIPFTITHFTPADGSVDVGTTFRPQIFFSRPVNASTLTNDNFYVADANGTKLPATIVPANDGTFAWLFLTNPMPGGSNVTVHVDGATIMPAVGTTTLDPDADGTAGDTLDVTFGTVSLVPLEGTSLSGIVLDPGPDLKPMTFDDIRSGPDGTLHTADDIYLNRIAGVKVFIVGLEDQAVFTNAQGQFSFASVPVGNVKLAIDGRTATSAPSGFYFPEMVMDLNLQPGIANNVMSSMGTPEEIQANLGRPETYLPRLRTSILQNISSNTQTMIGVDAVSAPNLTAQQRQGLTLQIQPGSLIGADGLPLANGQVGISTVPPDLVRDMLPPGLLQHTFDITIQAPDAATFAQPAPITFPNVFNSAPGTKLDFLSFDHTTGRLVIEGTATVSPDGLTVTTDPGFGITKPGWHGLTPPGLCGGSGGPPPPPPPPPAPQDTVNNHDPVVLPMIFAESGSFPTLTWRAPDKLPDTPPPPPPPPGCTVPDRPDPGNQQQPYLNVTIDVDGPMATYMKKASGTTGALDLASQGFTLQAGQPGTVIFGAEAKTYTEVYGADGIKKPLDNELFGTKVKVTEIRGKPDGSRQYDYYTYYLYRFVNSTDDLPNDKTVEFEDTLADGTGGANRDKFIISKAGGGALPTVTVAGLTSPFQNFGGGLANLINFDPFLTGDGRSGELIVKTPDGRDVPGRIQLKGDATPMQHIFVDKASLVATLEQMAKNNAPQVVITQRTSDTGTFTITFNGQTTAAIPLNSTAAQVQTALVALGNVAPGDINVALETFPRNVENPPGTFTNVTQNNFKLTFNSSTVNNVALSMNAAGAGAFNFGVISDNDGGITADEKKYFDNLENDLVTPKPNERQQLADDVEAKIIGHFAGVADGIDSGNGANTMKILFKTISGGLLGDSSPAGGIDNSAATKTAIDTRANYNKVVQNFRLDDAVNRLFSGTVEAYPDTPLEGNANVTRQQFINTLAKSSAHEVGHTLGMRHSYKDLGGGDIRHVIVDGVQGNTDLMLSGEDLPGALEFRSKITLEAIRMALNLNYSIADGQSALGYYVAHYALGAFDTASGLPTPDSDVEPFDGPRLGLFETTGPSIVSDSFDFGNVIADGAGATLRIGNFMFVNFGSDPLVINNARVEGNGFSAVPLTNVTIAPGAGLAFPITFDPRTIGGASARIVVSSNDDTAPEQIALTGFGQAAAAHITLASFSNNLGGAALAGGVASNASAFTIRNDGATPLSISGIELGVGENAFSLTGVPANLGANPITLAFGESFTFGANFDPTKVGLDSAAIQINTNDPTKPVFVTNVVGTGLAPVIYPEWGRDYIVIQTPNLPGGADIRAKSNASGNFEAFLPNNQFYHAVVFDPATGLVSHGYGNTPSSGSGVDLTANLVFGASTAADSDFDGLPDDIELAIGTSRRKADTDLDGLRDFAEIEQGLDPLSGIVVPTGVVSAVQMQGQAQEVVIDLAANGTQTAYLATGSHGLAIVNTTNIQRPVLLGQIDLAGENNDVSIDASRGIAAVAGGSAGLHLVNVTNPSSPVLIQTIPLLDGASRVEVFDGLAYVASGSALVAIDISTGDEIQRVSLGASRLSDVAREGSVLYTLDESHRLSVVEIADAGITPRGTLVAGNANGRLFVGNGIAYLSADRGFQAGFITVNVSNPAAPVLISDVDNPAIAARQIVANGSGLGIGIGSMTIFGGATALALDVVSVADPANTGVFLTRYTLPAAPQSVTLSQGVAFVADGTAGLQIVNYRSFDDQEQAPSVSITSSVTDDDPGTPGVQVIEGGSIPVNVQVTDDVQIQRVDLLVNGTVVSSDASFPFDFVGIAPAVAPGVTNAFIQVRATDTGGNESLSNVLSYGLVQDLFPPTVVATVPPDGAAIYFTRSINVRFNEPIDVSRLTAAGVHLVALGEDGAIGGGDDVNIPVRLETRSGGRELMIFPDVAFDTGGYRVTVDAAIIADRGGNALADPVVLNFTVRSASQIRALSGTPAILRAPSANVGQEIGFKVDWNPSITRVKFPTINSAGTISSTVASPSRIDALAKVAFFRVPNEATTGDITIYGAPSLNFTGFANWNVADGFVDLIGTDGAGTASNDVLPGNGLYVDLDGSSFNAGRLESKTEFALTPGTYELQFQLAGSTSNGSNSVAISLGAAFSETVTRAQNAPFSTETRTINVAAATSGRIVFDNAGNDNFGALLGRVKLTNTTTGAVLIDDNFEMTSDESPLPLQIVPTLADVNQGDFGTLFHNGTLRLRGTGFVEGGSTINLGSTQVVDSNPFSGPDIFYGYLFENDGMNLTVPAGAEYGPITVTTAGGTSAPFNIALGGIVALATSGTPANAAMASANPGQAITLQGLGFDASTDVVFQTLDGNGTPGERVVRPIAFTADGTELTVVVPIDVAVTGAVGIVGDRNNQPRQLQVVPILESVDFNGIAANGSTASVRLRGRGIIEGNNTTYTFGSVSVVDTAINAGPNSGGFYQFDNDGADLTLPTASGAYHGAVTITTAGGTSAPFTVGFANISSVAASGTPANPALASANPGQAVTITGTGLTTATDFISQYIDGNGTLITRLINPSFASLDGTSATFVVPVVQNGAFALHAVGSANAPVLQVVPTLTYVDITGQNASRWRGTGFVEGNGTIYTFGTGAVTDTATGSGPNAGGFFAFDNDGADVAMPIFGAGVATIQTTGGTSAPIPWGIINPGLATTLYDMAFNPATGALFVATNTQLKQIDPANGVTLATFALPGGGSGNTGLQFLPSSMTLNGTLVPSGSLLVTNGGANPDRITAVNPATGATIATLTLPVSFDPVGGLYDAASGNLFFIDDNPNELVVVNPANGAIVSQFTMPFDINYGGIALDPASGHLFIGTSQTSSIYEVTTSGALVRTIEMATQGLHPEVSGLAFNGAGQLLATSYNRGVVYRLDLTAPPAITQATITSITGSASGGVAANGAQASANANQIIEINGTNFGAGTQVIFPSRDQYGNVGTIGVAPLSVNAAGTRMQVQVPALAQTGAVMVNNIGSNANLGFAGHTDAIYRAVTMNFTATGASSALRFADGGLQGINDESWGIDNVRVVRVSDSAVIYSSNFENGAGTEWSDRTTDESVPGVFTEFLGRFSGGGSTLNVTTDPGAQYRLEFDFYAIDSWDGEATSAGPDVLNIFVNGAQQFRESFSNYSQGNVQSFRAAAGGSVPLQIVPLVSGIGGRPGADPVFSLSGSGFMEGATTITVGGRSIVDDSTADAMGNVSGNNDQYYDLGLALSVEGPIRITTAGGYFEIPGPANSAPSFVELSGITASAAAGAPANPAQPSANTGQTITLNGRGFTSATLVQFDAVDDNGVTGVITRTGTPGSGGTQLSVAVPTLARTGSVRVVGSATVLPLQIVPVLRAIGGAVTVGQSIVLEGSGLLAGGLSVSIDGQSAAVNTRLTVNGRGSLNQQVVDVTVPAGAGGGVVTVTTPGGSFSYRSNVAIATQPDLTPAGEVGDTLVAALNLNLPVDNRVTVKGQSIGDNAFAGRDVDLFRLQLSGGDQITINVNGAGLLGSGLGDSYLRVFSANGTQLAADDDSGPGADSFLRLTIPANGTYYIGVSGYSNTGYNPAAANSGSFGSTGAYQLAVQRNGAGSSTLATGPTISATSGTAARPGVPSANTGQTITLSGSGLVTGDRVVFFASDSNGTLYTTVVAPTSIAPDGLSMQVVVPVNATSGTVRVERESSGVFLQIVPTLSDMDQISATYRGGTLRLRGSGFAEGNSVVHFGATTVTDTSSQNGPDVYGGFVQENDAMNVPVPGAGSFGPITVTTLGGTSAPFTRTFTGIVASATSGTPANGSVASANPGQAITLQGTGFDSTTDVLFQTIDGNGTRGERVVRPVASNVAGTELTITVPVDVAVTGTVSIVGDFNNAAIPLQIVPILENVDFTSIANDGTSAGVRVRGRGIIEGNGTTYTFGSVSVTDSSNSQGPNAGGFFAFDNDGADITVPTAAGNYHGAVTITTAGGTSAPFSVTFAGISGVALSGTPANAGLASANPGQSVTITGTGLTTSTDLITQYVDGNGTVITRLLNPSFSNPAGTVATFVVPSIHNGAFAVHLVGSANAPVLQVVPTLSSASLSGTNNTRLRGSGFVEGNGTVYSIGSASITDNSISTGPNTGGFYAFDNDGADVPIPVLGPGFVTVQTAGGTSAPIAWNTINPNAGLLYDVALDTTTGNLLVATNTEVKRIDAASGATLGSFALPGGGSGNTGLHILGGGMTLNGTAVPAGSLLVFNGGVNPDRVIAVNATSGAAIATLSLPVSFDAVGGLYDPTSGNLFLVDDNPNELVVVNPANGTIISRFTMPFDINYGGIALDPASGHLFIGTSQTSNVYEVTTSGALVRTHDMASQGIIGEISGLVFTPGGQLYASSTRGVVHRLTLPAPFAISQATITSITSTATGGVAANGGLASANASQIIEINGTNFGANTQIIFPSRDTVGNTGSIAVAPLAVNAAGTRMQVQVPALAQTGGVMVNNIGNTTNLGFAGHTDAIYRAATMNFTATGASTALRLADSGWQGAGDESWGVDNVRVVRVSDSAVIYSTDFESGAGPEWSERATDDTYPATFTEFLGRISGGGSTLTVPTTTGVEYRLEFDFYALDSLDGSDVGYGDYFEIFVNGAKTFHESFSNYAATNVQTFRAAAGGSVPLQIVPLITGLAGRPGADATFNLSGSGFMEGASTITMGGTSIVDSSTAASGGDVAGSNDQYYDLAAALAVEGPIRITTAGGYFEIAGPVNSAPAFISFTGVTGVASAGTPANPAQASANTGQDITLTGQGFTSGTLVQFDARDDNGIAGVVTRTGSPSGDGRQLTVTVPALARTGSIRVVGSATVVPLQIVPVLRAIGGAITAGDALTLEGTGLRVGGLGVSIDGQNATIGGGLTTSERGSLDQQIVDVTVPAGTSAGLITVTTPGGSFTYRPGAAIVAQPDITPPGDSGDTIAGALALTLPGNASVLVNQQIGDGTFTSKDVDLYQFSGNGGDLITVDVTRTTGFHYARLFNASGTQLAIDGFSGPNSNARITGFRLPAAGSYYIGVSGYSNGSYDPNTADSGFAASTGAYQLKVTRQEAGATALDDIAATAASGTPARGSVASANTGQTITIHGSGLLATDQVVFSVIYSDGNLTTLTVNPASVAGDGLSMQVVVPTNAASGTVRLARENSGIFLQVVPTLVDVNQGQGVQYHGANLQLRGTGFAEGSMAINFGATTVADRSANNGPDIYAGFVHENDAANVIVPSGAAFGPISVTTLGGTSAQYNLAFSGISATATSGTPANPAVASANPGQTITLNGSGFDTTTDVVFPAVDGNGTRFERVVRPASVNGDGTQITVVVPLDVANTGIVGIVGDKNAAGFPLQIIPVIESVDFTSIAGDGSTANARFRGAGFVEAGTTYRFGNVEVADGSTTQGANAGGFYLRDNDGADVTVPTASGNYHGAITVTTAGGTSAPWSASFAGITAVAATGTAANPALASANPNQTITLVGTGLTTATDIIAQYIDGSGNLQTRLFNPASAAADGLSATFVVPNYFNGAFALHIVGSSFSPTLQIVPILLAVTSTGGSSTRWRGFGFVEGNNTVYALGAATLTDTSISAGPNVGGFFVTDNDGADVGLGLIGTGNATITTIGGTSAPLPF